MKIVYIAHPISGDKESNMFAITEIVKGINTTDDDIVSFVPYYADCIALDDDNPFERARGIRNNTELFNRKVMDEVWLFGDRISKGMQAEVELAISLGIPVIPMTPETIKEFNELY